MTIISLTFLAANDVYLCIPSLSISFDLVSWDQIYLDAALPIEQLMWFACPRCFSYIFLCHIFPLLFQSFSYIGFRFKIWLVSWNLDWLRKPKLTNSHGYDKILIYQGMWRALRTWVANNLTCYIYVLPVLQVAKYDTTVPYPLAWNKGWMNFLIVCPPSKIHIICNTTGTIDY